MKSLKNQKDGKKVKNDYKMKCMDISVLKVEEAVSDIEKNVRKIRSVLDAHINRQYTEIRVIEKDGQWGDYSGIFYVNDEDERDIILKKAKEHFGKYFKDGMNHQGKRLGLFLFSPRSGKHLVEEMETNPEDKEMHSVLYNAEELG